MTLYLIGLGLWNEKDISVKGLETAKKCDTIYLEEYTSKLFGATQETFEKLLGKKIVLLDRKAVEQTDTIIKEAKNKKVCLLVGGDPTVATTHTDILVQAKKAGIETKVIHSSSVYTAVCESGLFIYKFGKSCSIPFPQPNFSPESFFDTILENQEAGLHTLVFLDIQADKNKYMTINEALEIIVGIAKKRKDRKITTAIGIARLGSEDQIIKYGKIPELQKFDFGGPLHVLIIPGKLHFMEEEALKQL